MRIQKSFFLSLIFAVLLTIFSNTFANEKLIFAIDLIRHGDRTPIGQIPNYYYDWKEGLGELTTTGVNQEIRLGQALRKSYVTQYHLLPALYDPKTVYVRSTDFHRTVKSAQSLLLGLYPVNTRQLANPEIPIFTVANKEDLVLATKPDQHFFPLMYRHFENHNNWDKKTKSLQPKLTLWSQKTGILLDNFEKLEDLADSLYILQLHHLPLPKGITSSDADEIISLAEWGFINQYKSKSVTNSTGRAFLALLTHYFQEALQKKTPLKYVLLSGHDSSILTVMNTLDSPLEKIPGYASHLNFALFENDKKYYIKINYNNKPVNIPLCGGNICTVSQFYQLANIACDNTLCLN